jgi:hypothetical protein
MGKPLLDIESLTRGIRRRGKKESSQNGGQDGEVPAGDPTGEVPLIAFNAL